MVQITTTDGKKYIVKIISCAMGFAYADNLRLPMKDIMAIQPVK